MRKIFIGLIFILLAGVPGLAQDRKTQPESVETIEPQTVDREEAGSDQGRDDALVRSGTNLDAELTGTLDIRRAAVGDEVVLKTTKKIKENGRVIIPKGTRLIGRITEIQQKTEENGMARIGIIFDSIEGKNLSAPISASIISITGARNNVAVGDLFSSGSQAGVQSNTSGGSSGGGLLGGATQTVGSTLGSATQTVGGVTDSVGQTTGRTVGTVGNTVRGIRLDQAAGASANGSTTLSSTDKNLRIEKGATFQLRLNSSIQN